MGDGLSSGRESRSVRPQPADEGSGRRGHKREGRGGLLVNHHHHHLSILPSKQMRP